MRFSSFTETIASVTVSMSRGRDRHRDDTVPHRSTAHFSSRERVGDGLDTPDNRLGFVAWLRHQMILRRERANRTQLLNTVADYLKTTARECYLARAFPFVADA
jgi:hypothetical protein